MTVRIIEIVIIL